jgi:hypothetical protein
LGLQQDYEQECLEDILETHGKLIKKEIKPLVISKQSSRIRKNLTV